MKRFTSLLVAVLALTLAGFAAAQSQDPYAQGSAQPSSGTVNQAPATDQGTATTDPSTMSTSSQLPATASPMPLIGLSGLVALAAGAAISRRRRKA